MRITFNNDINRVVHFVNICSTYKEDIDVKAGRYIIDAKSILGMCAICTMPHIEVCMLTDDDDCLKQFINAIQDYSYTGE